MRAYERLLKYVKINTKSDENSTTVPTTAVQFDLAKMLEAELKEMDEYAASLGMELIVSMQTLAHLEQFLQWPKAAHLRDNTTCLLIDEEETTDVTCQFCDVVYHFERKDLEELRKAQKK